MHNLFRTQPSDSPTAAPRVAPRTDGITVRFTNCRLLRDHKLHDGEDLWVRDGVIADPKSLFWEGRMPDKVVDCGGRILAPGLIDLQVGSLRGSSASEETALLPALTTCFALIGR